MLTQICLIITLWSPGPAGAHNNSYWLNMAFKHANAAKLWSVQPATEGRARRRRILWWCCLIRDRILALGMRRPYRLHKAPFEEMLMSTDDISLEPSTSYLPTEARFTRTPTLEFIWLCNLSEIMAAIAIYQQRANFSREWNNGHVENDTSELKEVETFERDIKNWKDAFEGDVEQMISGQDHHDVPIAVSSLRIVCK